MDPLRRDLAGEVRRRVPEHREMRRARVEDAAVRGEDRHEVARVLGQRAEVQLAGAQLLLRLAVQRDVAEAPHAAGDRAADAPRLREALEGPSVAQHEDVEALRLGLAVELLHLGEKGRGVGDVGQRGLERALVVARHERLVGQRPHVDEAAVVGDDLAARVDHEDAVGGRVEHAVQDLGGRLEDALDVLDRAPAHRLGGRSDRALVAGTATRHARTRALATRPARPSDLATSPVTCSLERCQRLHLRHIPVSTGSCCSHAASAITVGCSASTSGPPTAPWDRHARTGRRRLAGFGEPGRRSPTFRSVLHFSAPERKPSRRPVPTAGPYAIDVLPRRGRGRRPLHAVAQVAPREPPLRARPGCSAGSSRSRIWSRSS